MTTWISSSRNGLQGLPSRGATVMPRPVANSATSAASLLDPHLGRPQILAMKVAGSGRTDLVQLWSGGGGELHATTYLSSPAGGGAAFRRASDRLLGVFGHQLQILPGDVDGDGRADLIVAYADGPGRELKLAVFLSNGSGFTAGGVFATGEAWSPRHLAFFALDASGDGRTDVVEAYERRDAARGGLLTFRTFSSLFGERGKTFAEAVVGKTAHPARCVGETMGFWPLDPGGAGDLVRVHRRACDDHMIAEVFLARPAAAEKNPFAAAVVSDLGAFPQANQQTFFSADLDGDGIPDLVQAFTEVSERGARLHLKTFFGHGGGHFATGPESIFEDPATSPFHLLDAGPGGSPTLLRRWIGAAGRQMFATYRSNRDGIFRKAGPVDAGPAGPGAASALFLVGDTDGDGHDDLIRLRLDAVGRVEALPYPLGARSEPLPAGLGSKPARAASAAGG